LYIEPLTGKQCRIVPFAQTNDTSVEFFFKPTTLTALAIAMCALAYVAMSNDVIEEGVDKQRL
jgi:phosphatidylserine synthase 2